MGSNVTQFRPGDEVFGDLSACGYGAFAEYVCGREDAFALKPTTLSFEQAATVPLAAVTALQGLRDSGHIQPGQKVLINGTSGGVGTFAVQIAKAFGAEVTAVCSTGKVEHGARAGGRPRHRLHARGFHPEWLVQYDLILAANGYHPLSAYQRALSPNGIYVMTGGSNAADVPGHAARPLAIKEQRPEDGELAGETQPKGSCSSSAIDSIDAGKVKPVIRS